MNTKRKKVAFVIQRYGEEVNGGAEKYAQQVAEKLAGVYDIDMLTTCALDHVTWKNHYNPGPDSLHGIRIRRFRTDCERDFGELARLTRLLEANRLYAERIRDEVGYIYAQGPVSHELTDYIRSHRDDYEVFVFLGFIFYPAAVGLQLVSDKSILVPFAHDEMITGFRFMKQLFNLPRKILFCTPEEQALVQRVTQNRHIPSEVVGLGFTAPVLADLPDFRAKYDIHHPFLLYVGRIEEGKGCQELLDHYQYYRDHHPDEELDLVLIGKSAMTIPDRQHIHYLGFVDEAVKHAAMQEALALAVPSAFESLSMVFMESLLCGTPPIVNAQSEVLKGHCLRGNCGLYYESREEFAGCVERMKTGVAAEMAVNGQAYVHSHYDWQVIVRQFMSAIDAV